MPQLSSHQLEEQVIAMENHLASVKITVEKEQKAWAQIAQGQTKKWAKHQQKKQHQNKTTKEDITIKEAPDISLVPSQWDSLELAHFLQEHNLNAYALLVIHAQISGQMILESSPHALRQLFHDIIQSDGDPDYQCFKGVVSQLHKTQYRLEKEDPTVAPTTKRKKKKKEAGAILPVIPPSPRIPLISASAVHCNSTNEDKVISKRKAVPSHKPTTTITPPMSTCWTCSARFPRAQLSSASISVGNQSARPSANTPVNRVYCSKKCQNRMEQNDISVSPSLSLASSENFEWKENQDTVGSTSSTRTPRIRPRVPPPSDSFDFICTPQSHFGRSIPSEKEVHVRPPFKQPPTYRRNVRGLLSSSIQGFGSSSLLGGVSSIPGIRTLPDASTLGSLLSHSLQCTNGTNEIHPTISSLSKYKLDPDSLHNQKRSFGNVFDPRVEYKTKEADPLLFILATYLNIRGLYYVSLTNRRMYELIHDSVKISDSIWRMVLFRKWQTNVDREVVSLQQASLLPKHYDKNPRKTLMNLTRHFQTLVLDNMKVLVNTENWQFATIDENGLYDTIAIIWSGNGTIVAIQAQGMIRPLNDSSTLTEILQGIQQGTLQTLHCRRLRLFSTANRLGLEEWYCLSQVSIVFEFVSLATLSCAWHHMILKKLQSLMTQRLLGKDSIQQVLKWLQIRQHHYHPTATVYQPGTGVNTNPITQDALAFLEQFLVYNHRTKRFVK